MMANPQFLIESFQRFNREIFSGELPVPRFELTRSRTFVGKLQYRIKRNRLGQICGYHNYVLKISILFDLPENELEDVVIHEMIHFWILVKNLKDSSSHGPVFRQLMNDINSRFGRNISISHKGLPNLDRRREHYVCVCQLKGSSLTLSNGTRTSTEDKVGIVVCSKEMAQRLAPQIMKTLPVADTIWYRTNHLYFNKYPHVRTPKLFLEDSNVIDDILHYKTND